MIAQHDAKRCQRGCCFYLGSQPASEADYMTATRGVIRNSSVPTHETTIACLNIELNRKIARKIGYYIGWAVTNSMLTGEHFVYDTEGTSSYEKRPKRMCVSMRRFVLKRCSLRKNSDETLVYLSFVPNC